MIDAKSKDCRTLAVAWKSIEVLGVKYDLSINSPANKSLNKLYGFYAAESWGTWSAGKKSCIVINEDPTSNKPIALKIQAFAFKKAFPNCKVFIKCSSGHRGIALVKDDKCIKINLKKSLKKRSSRLRIGNISKESNLLNVSNANELPVVSVIILNYENYLLTKLAITAVCSSFTDVRFEILCVDNGSKKELTDVFFTFSKSFRLISLKNNIGFGPGNNAAAVYARGKYLLFLNNDAFLAKNAVSEMLKSFAVNRDCLICGCVLKYPDGTIQEAGASVQNNGHPVRHGRNKRAYKINSLHSFIQVDYVSGACLMIPKDDFLKMGGFSNKYSPAYYEDTDLCMRSLLYNKKVYLASKATCYHIENATSGIIESPTWASTTAENNRKIFLEDWGEYLKNRDPSNLPVHLYRIDKTQTIRNSTELNQS